jgi:hypothetical protein
LFIGICWWRDILLHTLLKIGWLLPFVKKVKISNVKVKSVQEWNCQNNEK